MKIDISTVLLGEWTESSDEESSVENEAPRKKLKLSLGQHDKIRHSPFSARSSTCILRHELLPKRSFTHFAHKVPPIFLAFLRLDRWPRLSFDFVLGASFSTELSLSLDSVHSPSPKRSRS